MSKPPFLNNHIYHIYNRGVEKRDIFMDDGDYIRFIHHLYSFNDINTPLNLRTGKFKTNEVEPRLLKIYDTHKRELLIEILAFALMPNHYHLMVRQKTDGGIVKFMQKLGTGYTMFFNEKYDRSGHLFQGKFKTVLIEEDAHFMYLPYYIHLNPLALFNKRGSTSFIKQVEFLEEYKWSSLSDYIGKKNFPSVIHKDFLMKSFDGEKMYRKEVREWLRSDQGDNFNSIKEILLD